MASDTTEANQEPSSLVGSNPLSSTSHNSSSSTTVMAPRQAETGGQGRSVDGALHTTGVVVLDDDHPTRISSVDLAISSSSEGPSLLYRHEDNAQSSTQQLPLNSLTVSSSSSSSDESPTSRSRSSPTPPALPPPPIPAAARLTQPEISVGTARAVQVYQDALQFDRQQQQQQQLQQPHSTPRNGKATTNATRLTSLGSRGSSISSYGSNNTSNSSLMKSPQSSLRPLYPSLDRLSSIPDVVTETPIPTTNHTIGDVTNDRDPVLDELTASAANLSRSVNSNGSTHRSRVGKYPEKDDEEEKREVDNVDVMASAEEFVFASEALGWEGMDLDYYSRSAAAATPNHEASVVALADVDDEELLELKRQAYDPWRRTGPAQSMLHGNIHDEMYDSATSPQHATVVSFTDPLDAALTASSAVARQVSAGSVHAVWIGHDDTTPSVTSSSQGHVVSSQFSTVASSSLAELDDSTNYAAAGAATATASAAAAEDDDHDATEVTVLDHAPLHSYHNHQLNGGYGGWEAVGDNDSNHAGATLIVPTWKCHGEAQVLEDCDAHMDEYDSKPPAIENHHRTPQATTTEQEEEEDGIQVDSEVVAVVEEQQFAVAHPEAEVVDIQNDVHPLEYIDQQDAQAELVGVVATHHASGQLQQQHASTARHIPSESEASAVAVATGAASATTSVAAAAGHETPTAAAVATMVDYDVQQQTPTVSNVSVIRNGFARAPPLPSRAPFGGRFSNPFEDDPNDPPSLSLDAIAQLDAQADQSWMAVPTIVEHDPNLEPATPVAATLPMTSETATASSSSEAAAARPLKTVESEMPPRDWGDDNNDDYYRPHRREEVPDWLRDDSARDLPARPPPPRPFGNASGGPDHRSTSQTSGFSVGSQRSLTGGPAPAAGNSGVAVSGGPTVTTGGMGVNASGGGVGGIHMMSQVMEALFGDAKPSFLMGRSVSTGSVGAGHILTRILLPWSVIYNPTKKMWVATLQTNQTALDSNDVAAASKSLRAFSLPTEKRAICLAQAWTPPRMHPFSDSPTCHICDSRFAVFRRACHCRNCGVCICRTRECAVQWPSKMIPETYNLKREAYVNICKTCDWLCNSFRLSLLEGDFDKVVALHSTGNINVNSPFANVKGELFYPVHCAVLGGNLELLRWLVDEHCCPIKSVRVSGKTAHNAGTYTPIVTSKGRSLLGIAMETGNIPIMRYLVVEKGISVAGEKDITTAMLVQSFTAVLFRLPADALHDSPRARGVSGREESGMFYNGSATHFDDDGSALMASNGRTLSEEARDLGAIYKHRDENGDDNLSDHDDECIICYDNKIDCVSNPCGHQIMCMTCAENVSRCPVCAAECTFIRVYKP